jgi:hypothetical protein
MKTLGQDRQPPAFDLNGGIPKYKTGLLTI